MNAKQALREIQERVDSGRYIIRPHFSQRLRQRGIYWSEVLAIVESPENVKSGGQDSSGRDRWFLTGETFVGDVEMLLVLDDRDINFWTVYWS